MEAVEVLRETAREEDLAATARAAPRPDEVPFGFDELFYSRTDLRGVLIAGNQVFQRIAGHPWERLIGAPHRIIRHPDTPKGLFWLMWSRLKAGKPIGAYVKNQSSDGRHYWVFAVTTPVEGGYLSVRIKPSSVHFAKVRALYSALRQEETTGLAPEESARSLVARLGVDNGTGYDGFMAQALMAELASRRMARGMPASAKLDAIAAVSGRVTAVTAAQAALLADFSDIRSFPTNLRIAARRLETSGAPVASLAENYRVMADEISGRIESLTQRSDQSTNAPPSLSALLAEAQFLSGAVELQREAIAFVQGQPGEGLPFDPVDEGDHLARLAEEYGNRSRDGLMRATQAVSRLSSACTDIRKLVLGLNSIRVLCRVEAGRLLQDGEALHSIIARLDSFHAQVDERLGQVDQLASDAHSALSNALVARD
jgi:aerotaxis receptor